MKMKQLLHDEYPDMGTTAEIDRAPDTGALLILSDITDDRVSFHIASVRDLECFIDWLNKECRQVLEGAQ